MKVKLKDLRANPYRDIENYPINWKKVDTLVESYKETGFWGGIQAREINGEIQIAYGHHRLEALKKHYGLDHEIEQPINDLSDTVMFKMMSRENMEDREVTALLVDETITSGIEFLKTHLDEWKRLWDANGKPLSASYSTALKMTKDKDKVDELKNLAQNFSKDHANIDARIMHKLTGYSENRINQSMARLNNIKKDHIEEVAVREVSSSNRSLGFTAGLNKLKKKHDIVLTPTRQKEIARKVEAGEFGDGKVAEKMVSEVLKERANKRVEEAKVATKEDRAEAERKAKEAKQKELSMSFDGYVKKAEWYTNDIAKFAKEMVSLQKEMSFYEVKDKDRMQGMLLSIRAAHRDFGRLLEALDVKTDY